jgi:putative transposase
MQKRNPSRKLPAILTSAPILKRSELVKPRHRCRRAHPGCPRSVAAGPNDIWTADYKGQFQVKNGKYCFPLTISDLSSRFILGIDAHPAISLERTFAYFIRVFQTHGLPNRIRTENRVPFASNALARLLQLSVWFIKLGIYLELIEPGEIGLSASAESMAEWCE